MDVDWIYVDIMTEEKIDCNFPMLFIGQFVNPVGLKGKEWGKSGGMGKIVILARYKFHFIREISLFRGVLNTVHSTLSS